MSEYPVIPYTDELDLYLTHLYRNFLAYKNDPYFRQHADRKWNEYKGHWSRYSNRYWYQPPGYWHKMSRKRRYDPRYMPRHRGFV